MKKTKSLVTMAATAAITLTLVTTAFAAPAGIGYRNGAASFYNQNGANTTTGSRQSTGYSQPTGWQNFFGGQGWNSMTPAPTPTKSPASPAPTPTKSPASPAPTATPSPTAGTAPVPPVSGNMSADESKMVNLVNQDRASNGLKPLTFDSGLRAGALAHSQDMAQNNYFSHTSPTQGDFSARIKASGVKHSAAGENIAKYGSVDQAEAGFMNSPGHRANILGDYTRVGIGIVNKNGTYYITQWFAK